jgi:hypothetical protein
VNSFAEDLRVARLLRVYKRDATRRHFARIHIEAQQLLRSGSARTSGEAADMLHVSRATLARAYRACGGSLKDDKRRARPRGRWVPPHLDAEVGA